MDFAFQWNLSENRSKKILGVKFYPQGQKHFERLKEHASLSDTGVVPVDDSDPFSSPVPHGSVLPGCLPFGKNWRLQSGYRCSFVT